MRVRLPSKHDGPVATCETLGSEWEQSVADGMNRSQDKHSFARMAHPPFLMPERFCVVAQLVEQRPRNAQVTGSNPVDGSFPPKTDLFFPPLSGWFFFGKPATGQAWRIPVMLP